MSGSWDGGKRVAGAAALAVERVNADKTLLPGRRLEYGWADSGCSAQKGLAAMGELLGGASKVDAVIGPACSSACEVTSYLSGGQKIPQISWGCTASSLSNKEKYRLVRHLLKFLDCAACCCLIAV
jgi:ABC-type branched-subunit amino acid transport system substrate-binding protein